MNLEVSGELEYESTRMVHETKKPKIGLRYFRDECVQNYPPTFSALKSLEKKFVLITQKSIWYVCESVCSFALLACPWSQLEVIGWIKN